MRVRIAGGSDGGGDPLLPVFPTAGRAPVPGSFSCAELMGTMLQAGWMSIRFSRSLLLCFSDGVAGRRSSRWIRTL